MLKYFEVIKRLFRFTPVVVYSSTRVKPQGVFSGLRKQKVANCREGKKENYSQHTKNLKATNEKWKERLCSI